LFTNAGQKLSPVLLVASESEIATI